MYREVVDGRMRCKDCKEWIPVESYQLHGLRNGRPQRSSYCPSCKHARGRVDAAKLRYGLKKEAYFELVAAFPTCAICNTTRNLFIDHDHKTGEVRGRLCRACNTAIGLLKEDLHLLDAAKAYLTRFSSSC